MLSLLCDCAHLDIDSSFGSPVVERHTENNTNSRITIGQEALFTKAAPAEFPSTARFFCARKKWQNRGKALPTKPEASFICLRASYYSDAHKDRADKYEL